MKPSFNIVVVAVDRRLAQISRTLETRFSTAVTTITGSGEEALEVLRRGDIDVLITGTDACEMSAQTLITRAKTMNPTLPVVMVGNPADWVKAGAAGANAFACITEPDQLYAITRRFLAAPAPVAMAA